MRVAALYVRGNRERHLLRGQGRMTAKHVPADVVRDWPLTLSLDDVVYCHGTPAADGLAEELLHPPTVERLLERLA